MEASSAANEVISGGAHHRGLHGHCLLVVTLFVVHECPDPQRALVVGTKIVTSDVLLAKGIVVSLSLLAESRVGPLDGGVIDLGASVANLIVFVEVGELSTTFSLDCLSGAELGLDLGSSDGVVASVELVEPVVLVLSDCDGLELAVSGSLLVTRCGDRGQMDWSDGLDTMEVIVIDDLDVLVVEGATHHRLGIGTGPGVTLEASGNVGVLTLVTIARRLERVGALHLDTLEKRLQDGSGVRLDILAEVLLQNLVDEGDDSGAEILLGCVAIDVWDKILLHDGLGGVTSHVTHVR